MKSPAIRELRARDRKAFAQFTEELSAAAQAAGLRVERANSEESLRVGGIFVSLETFFHQRRGQDAMAKVIARIQELIALKSKRG
jgi:hypothetical protein